MLKTVTLIITLLTAINLFAQSEIITVLETVKVKNNNYAEAIYYFDNNWKILRQTALERGYIHSFELIESRSEKKSDFDIVLITRYFNKEQYDQSEGNFQNLIKELITDKGGLKLKNEIKPNDFRENIFAISGKSLIFSSGKSPIKSPIEPPIAVKEVSNSQNPKEKEEIWYLPTEDKASFLYIHEVGKGEPVVVLHGGPGAGHQYILDIAKGLENQFRFIFYDQRGAGLSHAAKDSISMGKHVKDLEQLRKALGLEKLNLISHSFGTMLAMNYLQTFPNNVKNIALLGALDPKNGNTDFFSPAELKLFEQKNDEVAKFESRPQIQAEIKQAGLDKPNLTAKEADKLRCIRGASGDIYYIERWRRRLCIYVNREGAFATRETTNFLYDWAKLLSVHPHSITVINGEFDYVVGPKGSPIWKRVTATEAKNVKLVLLEKAGHLLWIDQPVLFRTALKKALSAK